MHQASGKPSLASPNDLNASKLEWKNVKPCTGLARLLCGLSGSRVLTPAFKVRNRNQNGRDSLPYPWPYGP